MLNVQVSSTRLPSSAIQSKRAGSNICCVVAVLMADPNWNRGFYYDGLPPHTGMKLARREFRTRGLEMQTSVLIYDFNQKLQQSHTVLDQNGSNDSAAEDAHLYQPLLSQHPHPTHHPPSLNTFHQYYAPTS